MENGLPGPVFQSNAAGRPERGANYGYERCMEENFAGRLLVFPFDAAVLKEGMLLPKTRFGSVISCIDGRAQLPVIEWMKKEFRVDYIDMITEPAVVKILSHGDECEIGRLRSKARISVEGHGSGVIAVVGHYDCFANRVSEREHANQIKNSVLAIQAWDYPVSIVGLWVGKDWKVDRLDL